MSEQVLEVPPSEVPEVRSHPEPEANGTPSPPKASEPKVKTKVKPKKPRVSKPKIKKESHRRRTPGKSPGHDGIVRPNSTTPELKAIGLQGPHVLVLKALARTTKALTRTEIGERAKVNVASLTRYVGSPSAGTRRNNERSIKAGGVGYKSLVTLGYVKEVLPDNPDQKSGVAYQLTAAGRKKLPEIKDAEDAAAERKAKESKKTK
jgi:hypothetical protein